MTRVDPPAKGDVADIMHVEAQVLRGDDAMGGCRGWWRHRLGHARPTEEARRTGGPNMSIY